MIRLACPLCSAKGVDANANRHDPKGMSQYRGAMVCSACASGKEAKMTMVRGATWRWRCGERHGNADYDHKGAVLRINLPVEAIEEGGTTLTVEKVNG